MFILPLLHAAMSREQANTEWIEKYLDGTLSAEEKKLFEAQLKQDEELTEEVKLHQDIRLGIQLFASSTLKETLGLSDQDAVLFKNSAEPKPSNANDGQRLYTWMVVAASLSTILFLGYLLLENTSSDQALVSSYYQSYPNILNPVNRSAIAAEDVLTHALHAYEERQFQEAITLFEKHEGNMQGGYRFYYALSFLETDQPEQAIEILETVVEERVPLFYHPALWYQALAYLKINQKSKAREKLNILAEVENSYQQNANALLEALD